MHIIYMYNTFFYKYLINIVRERKRKRSLLLESCGSFFWSYFFFAAGKFQTIYSKRARNTLKQTNEYLFPRKKNNALTHSYVYRMGTALCGEDEEEEEEDVTSLENAEKM